METAKYTIRSFISKDIFAMSKILTAVGFREFKDVFINARNAYKDTEKTESVIESIGITVVLDAVGVILANLDKAEKDIYKFLASITGEDVKTLENLPLEDFIAIIKEIATGENFKDFIKAVTSLLK